MDKVARDVHEWMEMHGEPTAADRFRENVVYLRMNVSNTHSYIGETANWTQRVQRHRMLPLGIALRARSNARSVRSTSGTCDTE